MNPLGIGRKRKEEASKAVETKAEATQGKSEWDVTLETLKEKDPELYDFAAHLHLDPRRAITEKARAFLKGTDVDPLEVSPDTIADEAEKCNKQGMTNRAINGYICAIDLTLLQASASLSKGEDARETDKYAARIAAYASRLHELDVGSGGDAGTSWLGLFKSYEILRRRAKDALDIAMQSYRGRLEAQAS